ncbi:hypothetical protein A5740_19220 [Mycobacterium sp. GA-1841]|nr:hypothetical protein A5740_19220 [Mycobacterium sp. GA-1841]
MTDEPEAQAMSRDRLSIRSWPFLTAEGDGTQLVTRRSLAFSTADPRYLPVLHYIRDFGLVLVSSEFTREEDIYGLTEVSHYATPDARNLILMNTT